MSSRWLALLVGVVGAATALGQARPGDHRFTGLNPRWGETPTVIAPPAVPVPQGSQTAGAHRQPWDGYPPVAASPPWEEGAGWPGEQRRIPFFGHSDPHDPARAIGAGDPLIGTSWLNRPYHVGWMVGVLWGDELVQGRVAQEDSLVGGYRIGWDFDHYWGVESRFLFANVPLTDTAAPLWSATAQQRAWDVDLLYYPWGDARWRPFLSLGVGTTHFEFRDAGGQQFDQFLLTLPVGGGIKYYWKRWLALRISVVDQWTPGQSPLHTVHNLTLTGDVEVHWGGRQPSYFPYHGSIHLW